MLINFLNPVMPVDNAFSAFVEILNLIVLSEDFTELSRGLHQRDAGAQYGCLSGYFFWSYAEHTFSLWQRFSFGSGYCFPGKILEVRHIAMVTQDRHRPQMNNH